MKHTRLASLVLLLCAALYSQAFAQTSPAPTPPATPAPQTAAVASANVFPHEGFADEAEKLLPAVVNISTTQIIKEEKGAKELPDFPQFQPGSPFEDFFKDFMEKHKGLNGPGGIPKQRKSTSLGSGYIIAADGLVVTNNHVIEDADEITVILHDDTNLKAEVVGRDKKTDIALLRVKSKTPLPYVSFGDSDKMRIGDWILVIGNPFGLGGTVTTGIISARARDINSGPYDDYIQTDAPINRGNSGGPMFNMKGEVIGMNTAIFSPSGGSVGIGFAIPSTLVKNVVEQLKGGGKIRRGWLGVRIQNVTEEIAKSLNLNKPRGALVSSLSADSPAAKGGVKAGDVIIAFDDKPVNEMRRLPRIVAEAKINEKVPMIVWRDGKEVMLSVMVGELKEDETADGEEEKIDEEKAPKLAKSLPIPEFDIKVAVLTPEARKAFDIDEKTKGIVITDLGENSPLEDKGIKPGDVIAEAGQKEMKDPKDLAALAKDAATSKKPLLLLISRQGDLRFVAVNTIEPGTHKPKKDDKPKASE
ncbi:MAG: DegQ family serine endoprotease [Alphaproteobacteria bacterium]|nr:DegQ family serine endoprotease [Alphaproteobacteria bacterium]